MRTRSIVAVSLVVLLTVTLGIWVFLSGTEPSSTPDMIEVEYSITEHEGGYLIEINDVLEADYLEIVITREAEDAPNIRAFLNGTGSSLFFNQRSVNLTGKGYLKQQEHMQPNTTYIVTIASISGSDSEVELQKAVSINRTRE